MIQLKDDYYKDIQSGATQLMGLSTAEAEDTANTDDMGEEFIHDHKIV